ncbi:uncharacterized protein [Ptychodera flava]|uniref:uncharacterized protein n=1 Tax=Ptychodera flava TaxID=63121 RepID=UPI00396A436A
MQDYLQPSWMQLIPGSRDRHVVQNGHSYDDCCDVIDKNTSLGEVNVLIKTAKKEDNGTWICFMPRITIAAKTQVFVVDSGDPLCSTSHNMDLGNIVIKGSRTSLSCIIRNNIIRQHSLLTWVKKGYNITSEWNNSLNYSYEASVEDNGASFSCLLQNSLLKTTLECNSSITIEVQFKPSRVTLISEHSNDSSGILILRCETSSSYPAANIIWYQNGTPIDDRYGNGITRQPTVTMKGENNGFITQEELHITTTPGLNGYNIRCAARNPVFNETEDLVFSDVILVIHDFPPKQPDACDTKLKSTSAYQDSTINTPMELTCTTCRSYPPTDIKLYIDRKLFNITGRQTVNITSDLNGAVVASTAVLVSQMFGGFSSKLSFMHRRPRSSIQSNCNKL